MLCGGEAVKRCPAFVVVVGGAVAAIVAAVKVIVASPAVALGVSPPAC